MKTRPNPQARVRSLMAFLSAVSGQRLATTTAPAPQPAPNQPQ